MSISPEPTLVELTVRSDSPIVKSYIFDNDYRVVAEGAGTLRKSLPPGIYKIRSESGSAWGEDLFELPANVSRVEVSSPKLQDLVTPAPLVVSPETGPVEEQLAHNMSMRRGVSKGSGSQLFVFVRGTAEGLGLYDVSGNLLVGFGEFDPENNCTGNNVEVDPGSYLLRLERPDNEALEQTIVTCPGWQTQVFPPSKILSTKDQIARPDLANSAIFMARNGTGFHPGEEALGWVEMARQELARGRAVLGMDSTNKPAANAEEALQSEPDGDVLLEMLDAKSINPMLGIYAAHLMMVCRNPDLKLMRGVADRLRNLLGYHPDVEAIYLWLEASAATNPFPNPPMLRSSWSILVNRSRVNENLIPAGSYGLSIAGRLWGSGAWLVWRQPITVPRAIISANPEADWNKLSAWIVSQIGERTPQRFVREMVAEKKLTVLETTILRYFAEVIQAQRSGQNLAARLDREGTLGLFTAWYRKLIPSDLSKQLQQTAELFLSRDKIVSNLGLPMGAVDEAIAGLIVKLNSAPAASSLAQVSS